jgi:hypothetical protein
MDDFINRSVDKVRPCYLSASLSAQHPKTLDEKNADKVRAQKKKRFKR